MSTQKAPIQQTQEVWKKVKDEENTTIGTNLKKKQNTTKDINTVEIEDEKTIERGTMNTDFGTIIPKDWQEPVKDTRRTTDDIEVDKSKRFTDFHLDMGLQRGIYEAGYTRPSPIQWEAIPQILLGKDILARAKNGTGKTASYLIPILDTIVIQKPEIQAVVLVPNRELALQTSSCMMRLGKYLEVKTVCLVGGTRTAEDVIRIKQGAHAIVATPGRQLDIVHRMVELQIPCKYLVLDEADKQLSDDFIETIEEILCYIKNSTQQQLFSATYPASIEKFVNKYIRKDVAMINLMEDLTLKGITQYYVYLNERTKQASLFAILRMQQIRQCIIFCNSVRRVEALAKHITDRNISCYYIHSKMTQAERNEVFARFCDCKVKHLVASDVFTRGIDVQTVNVVINFDLPNTPETYLHRIGRSGRFGHYGLAVNLVTDHDKELLYQIENKLNTEITAFPSTVDPDLYIN